MPSKNVDENEFNDFYNMFNGMNGIDLAKEFYANKIANDDFSNEYKALVSVLNENGGVDKYNMCKTDLKSLEFAEYMDKSRTNILNSSFNYLAGVVKNVFGYTSLNGQKKGLGKDQQMKSFSSEMYRRGKDLASKLK